MANCCKCGKKEICMRCICSECLERNEVKEFLIEKIKKEPFDSLMRNILIDWLGEVSNGNS